MPYYEKNWTDEAWEEFVYWATYDKKIYKKIIELIKDIDRNGYTGIGKPEELKGEFAGFYSRRIEKKNPIVYTIKDKEIFFVQCGSHYRDK